MSISAPERGEIATEQRRPLERSVLIASAVALAVLVGGAAVAIITSHQPAGHEQLAIASATTGDAKKLNFDTVAFEATGDLRINVEGRPNGRRGPSSAVVSLRRVTDGKDVATVVFRNVNGHLTVTGETAGFDPTGTYVVHVSLVNAKAAVQVQGKR